MIDVKELRIGNYINTMCENGIMLLDKIDGSDISEIEIYPMDRYPIPLTQEWLIKLGYVKGEEYGESKWTEWIRGELSILRSDGIISYPVDNEGNTELYRPIKSVHYLQNFIYFTEGEELTITE